MNNRLLAGVAVVGLLAGGGSATALAAADAPSAAASTAAVASSTSKVPGCGPLGSLVARGAITQAQAIAIHKAFISYFQGKWRTIADTVLGQLVKNHTITQAQASAVIADITKSMQNYRGAGSGHQGLCHYGHGGGMMGGSGKP
jgi:hypothetical protein